MRRLSGNENQMLASSAASQIHRVSRWAKRSFILSNGHLHKSKSGGTEGLKLYLYESIVRVSVSLFYVHFGVLCGKGVMKTIKFWITRFTKTFLL